MNIRIVNNDNSTIELQPEITIDGEKTTIKLPKEKVPANIKYVDFLYDYFVANTGDKGYFVLPLNCEQGVCATYFKERNDTEHATNFSHICCYGYKKEKGGILGIVTGCREYYAVVAGVKNGVYYAYPRFMLDGFPPYEDIVVEYYNLQNGDYSEMARLYRKVQLERYGCIPLKERVKKDERLASAAESIAVRVRQGWKPAPSEVENQYLETEPEMHVACDFDRTAQLAGEFVKQGIDAAEFCLVGWSRMGHDGRYPQIFPVEHLLGGEEKLKALIKKVKSYGYNIVGHDNASDAYTVSEQWDEEYLLKNNDGSLHKMDIWSSGRAHKICPKRYYELFANEHLTKLKELGFQGIHYIDVITILSLLECHDKNHPLTRKESAEWYNKLMQESKEIFGGISSEAGYDYAASVLDFALYTSFFLSGDGLPEICDRPIPFWQLVFHGIILYNPGTYTLNYAAKGIENRLRYFEYGGRPLVCVYANFANGKDWMGREDIRCDTDEEMKDSVSKIKLMYDDYNWLKDVRFAFMESHNEIADKVFEIAYSNGIKVKVDYNTATVAMYGNNVNKVLKIS
ncbi:MAG: hypothetical protein IJD45_07830 [Clostridia bacterium]|nr:hypothetical protein [Clostridia bacterium]